MSEVRVPAFADSHVHLADAAFHDDVDDVIDRARAAGARALVCIGESPAAALRAERLAARFPALVYFTCGVHPHDAATWDDARDPDAICAAVVAGAVAIGECGLDYHYDTAPRVQQRRVLDRQLALAATLTRPVVLHTRDAEPDTRDMLQHAAAAGVRGVLHCYTGSLALAEAAIEAGWYLSFSGIVTFKSWTDLALLRAVPADRLLVESDAPYLAPVPHRGKRNESAFVPLTISRVAAARGCTPVEMAALTLQNTLRFFSIHASNPTFP